MYQLIEYQTGMKIRAASAEDRTAFAEAKKLGREYMMIGYHGYVLKAVVKKED